jgi:ABC-type uncharacterized transport system auxiliary subunit
MMRFMTIAAMTALLTTGCATTPIRYLTLDMTPSGSIDEGASVQIDEIVLSDALRRPELLVQARKTEIEYYSDAHWVSSLSELVAEKLDAEFQSSSNAVDAVRLVIKLWQFSEDETVDPRCGRVKLSVSAWIPGTSFRDEPDWSASYEACTPIEGEDVSDVAAALSDSLAVIALQINKDLSR